MMGRWKHGQRLRGPRAWPDVWVPAAAMVVGLGLSILGLVAVPGLLIRVLMLIAAFRALSRIRAEVPRDQLAAYDASQTRWNTRLFLATLVLLAVVAVAAIMVGV